ncbi:DUF4345 domain-containing protein [Bernardetia sp. Wsw4-3y2]|uniref:DUF4345 domain-containing protein n=1 Tax=Bernardetia sp. Wsw4-3y2 TaxID=3127471 RepID=UPI0030D13CE8
MKQSIYLKAILIFAGVIGISVGIGQMFFPIAFEASAGINVEGEVSLLSEIRAAGGTLLIAGIIMFWGAFRHSLSSSALFLAILFYLSYGLSRVYGIIVDGIPNQSLVIVTISEITIGLVAYIVYYRLRKKTSSDLKM